MPGPIEKLPTDTPDAAEIGLLRAALATQHNVPAAIADQIVNSGSRKDIVNAMVAWCKALPKANP